MDIEKIKEIRLNKFKQDFIYNVLGSLAKVLIVYLVYSNVVEPRFDLPHFSYLEWFGLIVSFRIIAVSKHTNEFDKEIDRQHAKSKF